jgi:acid phosphatase (class A)
MRRYDIDDDSQNGQAFAAYRIFFAVALLLGVLAGTPAFANERCLEANVPVALMLLPPPEEGSPETLAELQELQHLEAVRTDEQAKHAGGDHDRTIGRFLGEIRIKVENLPRSASDFFACIKPMTDHEIDKAKETFKRKRPYDLPNNNLHILKEVVKDDKPSYPSGHAAYGMVMGLILAEMLPKKRDEIFKRIEDYGHSRLVSGVHFRSDVYAGEVAGGAIAASLFKNKEFRERFKEAKKELRKAIANGK